VGTAGRVQIGQHLAIHADIEDEGRQVLARQRAAQLGNQVAVEQSRGAHTGSQGGGTRFGQEEVIRLGDRRRQPGELARGEGIRLHATHTCQVAISMHQAQPFALKGHPVLRKGLVAIDKGPGGHPGMDFAARLLIGRPETVIVPAGTLLAATDIGQLLLFGHIVAAIALHIGQRIRIAPVRRVHGHIGAHMPVLEQVVRGLTRFRGRQ